MDVDKTSEYMVVSRHGLYFIKIIQTKRPGNGGSVFKFEFSSEECYFKEDTVKGAFEYDKGKIIALVSGSKNIRFVNRDYFKEDTNLRI